MTLNEFEAEMGDWFPLVRHLYDTELMQRIFEKIEKDVRVLQPVQAQVFRAFRATKPKDVRVVILGQDPYPFGQADGLAFSSKTNVPYSLEMIYLALKRAGLGDRVPNNLDGWAKQGVLLLNSSLTTVYGVTEAHSRIGWQQFTGYILSLIAQYRENVVYMIWGSHARELIETSIGWRRKVEEPINNKLLYGPHPSAQRHGHDFLGCNHFKLCNEYLWQTKQKEIDWMTV